MKLSNQNSYPATFKFEQFLIKEAILHVEDAENRIVRVSSTLETKMVVRDTAMALHEMLGEYEHGTVDVDVVLAMVGMTTEARTAKMYYKMQSSDPESSASIEFENETYAIVEEARAKALNILEGIYEDIILTMKAI